MRLSKKLKSNFKNTGRPVNQGMNEVQIVGGLGVFGKVEWCIMGLFLQVTHFLSDGVWGGLAAALRGLGAQAWEGLGRVLRGPFSAGCAGGDPLSRFASSGSRKHFSRGPWGS